MINVSCTKNNQRGIEEKIVVVHLFLIVRPPFFLFYMARLFGFFLCLPLSFFPKTTRFVKH